MTIQIREYQEQDRPVIVRFFEDFQEFLITLDPLGRLDNVPGYGEAMLAKTSNELPERRGIFLVAEENEGVVGFIVGVILSTVNEAGVIPAKRGRITELYVDKRSRGNDVGRLLLQRAEDYLEAEGCQFIRVEVFAPNKNARGFYRHLGYQDYEIDMIKHIE